MKISKSIYLLKVIILFYIFSIKAQEDDVASKTFFMPSEEVQDEVTWMAYGATLKAWGSATFYGASRLIARKDLIRIAANVARFEPVKILINEEDLNEAKDLLYKIKYEEISIHTASKPLPPINEENNIQFIIQPVNDLWMRDTGPVFVNDKNNIQHGIDFNFNGWGQENTGAVGWKKCVTKAANGIRDQKVKDDQQVAEFIIKYTGVKKLNTWLVMEGGSIEVNGKGTAICTESSILNNNRNPGRSKLEVEEELFRLLGIKKVIWLPGVKGNDITDGHVDFYARFVGETKVLISLDKDRYSPDHGITHQNLRILSSATDAFGNKLTVIPLLSPDFTKVKASVNSRNRWKKRSYFNENDFAAGYVGFYLANNCVILSMFGDDKADKAAYDILIDVFPDRTVVQMYTDGIANGGGSIHCTTQQQFLPTKNLFRSSANLLESSANTWNISSLLIWMNILFLYTF